MTRKPVWTNIQAGRYIAKELGYQRVGQRVYYFNNTIDNPAGWDGWLRKAHPDIYAKLYEGKRPPSDAAT